MDNNRNRSTKKMVDVGYEDLIDDLDAINERLKNLREFRDQKSKVGYPLKQNEVSYVLGVIPQNYNKIEKGKRAGGIYPTLRHIVRLSLMYGVSTDYLLLGVDNTRPNSDDKSNREIERLKNSEKKYLDAIAELETRLEGCESNRKEKDHVIAIQNKLIGVLEK